MFNQTNFTKYVIINPLTAAERIGIKISQLEACNFRLYICSEVCCFRRLCHIKLFTVYFVICND